MRICQVLFITLFSMLSCLVKILDLYSFLQKHRGRPSAYIKNGSIAVSAAGREQIVIIRLAIRMALSFKEVSRAQLLVAVGAREVFRMPCLTQGRYHLCKNMLLD